MLSEYELLYLPICVEIAFIKILYGPPIKRNRWTIKFDNNETQTMEMQGMSVIQIKFLGV